MGSQPTILQVDRVHRVLRGCTLHYRVIFYYFVVFGATIQVGPAIKLSGEAAYLA